jgi:putative endonuclease
MSSQKSIISSNRQQGKLGEEIGLAYFTNKNYQVLLKNFKTQFGEIDLVLLKDDTVFFVEFKTVCGKLNQYNPEKWLRFQLKNMVFVIKVLIAKNMVPINKKFQIELVVIDLFDLSKVEFKRYPYQLENNDF